jgi:hypothetical protein
MSKQLRPTVDLMAFKCRTLKVKKESITIHGNMNVKLAKDIFSYCLVCVCV